MAIISANRSSERESPISVAMARLVLEDELHTNSSKRKKHGTSWQKLLVESKGQSCFEIFPVKTSEYDRLLAPGKKVWVLMDGKPFAQATICEKTDPNQFQGRIRVKYNDGSYYHCRPSRLCPIFGQNKSSDGGSDIIVCAETKHYRQLARLQPKLGELVLEIGSDLGNCTTVLAHSVKNTGSDNVSGGCAVGIDKSLQSVAIARNRFPDIPFERLDVLTSHQFILQEVATKYITKNNLENVAESKCCSSSFDVVFIDINGNRMIEAVAEVIAKVRNSKPRLIVVKSSEMVKCLENGGEGLSLQQQQKKARTRRINDINKITTPTSVDPTYHPIKEL